MRLKKINLPFFRNRELLNNRQVMANFTSLFLVQGVNFIIPVVIIPYIISRIGIEKFGVVSFIQVMIGYFVIIADYGFNLKGTRDISVNKENKKKLSHYISVLLHIKMLLCVACFVVLCGLMWLVPKFGNEAHTCLLAFIMVIGHTFNPVWFFQGIEQMKYITIINVLGKFALFGFVFLLVRGAGDYPYVLLSYGLSFIISSGTGLWLMFRKYHIHFTGVSWKEMKLELRAGFSFFLSNFSVNMYIHSNILILGFFTSDVITGLYSIIDKIIYAFRQILVVFFQATYPQMCRMMNGVRGELIKFQRGIFIPFLAVVFLGCVLLLFLAPFIYGLMSDGHSDPGAVLLLRAMSFVPFVIALSIPANQLLLAQDHKKSYAAVLMSAGIVCIILNLLLAPFIGMRGTAFSVIVTEIFATVGLHYLLWKKEKLPLLWLTFRKNPITSSP